MKLDFLNKVREKLLSGFGSSTLIGVGIGSSTLKIAVMRLTPLPTLLFCSIIDISGDKSDKRISEAVKKALLDNKISVKNAVLTFTDESNAIKRIELPSMAKSDVSDAVKWQMKEVLSYDIDKASLDFVSLDLMEREGGSKVTEFLVGAASREVIEKNIRILKEAGLAVVSVNLAPFGLENIVKLREGDDASKTVLAVTIGSTKADISIFSNKRLEFVRTVPENSSDISDALTGTLASNKGTISLTKKEADEVKIKIGVPYETVLPKTNISPSQILSMMRPVLERISHEIRRSISYYIQQYNGKDVLAIYLAGGGARLKNLDRFLSEELHLPVKVMELPGSIGVSKASLKKEDIPAFLSLIGALLGWKNRPNLLPYEYKTEKIEFMERVLLRMVAIIAGAVLLTLFLFAKLQVDGYRQRLKNVQFQEEVLMQVKELQDRVNERGAFLKQLDASEIHPAPVMRELRNAMPPNIVLDWLKVDLVARTMDMGGAAYGSRTLAEDELTKFMSDIEKSKHFKDAQLVSVQEVTDQKEIKSKFEINCMFE